MVKCVYKRMMKHEIIHRGERFAPIYGDLSPQSDHPDNSGACNVRKT